MYSCTNPNLLPVLSKGKQAHGQIFSGRSWWIQQGDGPNKAIVVSRLEEELGCLSLDFEGVIKK